MSGSIVRACGWQIGNEERYLAVNPNGESVALYQTNNNFTDEDDTIPKVAERTGLENIQCLQYAPKTVGRTAVGMLSGECLIFDILNAEETPISLRPRQARSCNSATFNDNGLVALGYDRGRQDYSLQVWDIDRSEPKRMHSLVQNESISSVVFTEQSNLIAGSYKLLREYDLKSGKPVYQLNTRCTLNLCVDPSNPHIFASNSDDGSIAIWDRRKLTDLAQGHSSSSVLSEQPMLIFRKLLGDYQRKNNGGSPYHFSSIINGELSAMFDGDLVRRWRIATVPPLKSEVKQYEAILEQNKSENPNFASKVPRPRDSLFIAKVTDVHTKYERVISFDYAPSTARPYGVDLVCMRQSGNVYRMPVIETQTAMHFDCFNGLSYSGPSGTCTKFLDKTPLASSSSPEAIVTDALAHTTIAPLSPTATGKQLSSSSRSPSIDMFEEKDAACLTSDALLENDICSIIRKRAALGYGTECATNMKVLESLETMETQSQLKNAWKWVDIMHNLITQGKLTYQDFDFGYMGVYGIWNIPEGFPTSERYYGKKRPVTQKDVMAAARAIVARRAKEIKVMAAPVIGFKGTSEKEIQRRFAMYVNGWDFSIQELEQKYQNLIDKGDYTRAAGWALFHSDIQRAISILGSSKEETLRIISTAMAGYSAFKDTPTNNTWKDQCRQLASDLDDPYLRVIFAYIADGNWWDVLDESALPLRERLGVALRFLKDNELDVYLDRLLEEETQRGEIEGIIVTGITHQGIDLLQSFVDRTSDTQSACLLSAFSCPRYFRDSRSEAWAQSYRRLLNSWGLFAQRAKYDVSSRALSKRIDGQQRQETVPRQAYLQCTNCHKSISEVVKKISAGSTNTGAIGSASSKRQRAGHACPHCGHPLPRCAICLITQGVPVPREMIHVDMSGRDEKGIRPPPALTPALSGAGAGTNVTGTPAGGPAVTAAGAAGSEADADSAENSTEESPFREWFSFCLSCNHCMHAGHAEEWFSKHYVCPVPDCNCKCNNK